MVVGAYTDSIWRSVLRLAENATIGYQIVAGMTAAAHSARSREEGDAWR